LIYLTYTLQISSERQLSLERIKEQSNSELKRNKNQIFDNNNKISQLSKSIIDKKEIIKFNSQKIKDLSVEIDDLKSKQSASLEINEALLKNEINHLKNDLQSKSDIVEKYLNNLNTWKKDDKTINKYLVKHDKYLNRKNLLLNLMTVFSLLIFILYGSLYLLLQVYYQ
jgi:chromosome segregation ATPase